MEIYHIDNGFILTESDLDSLIFNNKKELVSEVSLSVDPLFADDFNAGLSIFRSPEHRAMINFKPESEPVFINGAVANLTCFSCVADSYGHWMTDVLPRLAIYIKSRVHFDYLYMPYKDLVWQNDILSLLKISKRQIIPYPQYKFLRCKQIISSPFPRPAWDVPEWIPRLLRSLFPYEIQNGKEEKKIYATRKDAKWRKVLNENDFEIMLKKFGFEILTMANLSVAQKINLFSNSEFVISIHGSTLSNTFFSKPNTRVLEIFGPGQRSPLHYQIAQVNDLKYYSLHFSDNLVDQLDEKQAAFTDFNVNLDIVEEFLDKTLTK
jgi:capsular polysaccharide biosynthesis protein